MLENIPTSLYTTIATLLAIVPAITILVMIYRLDKVEKEPTRLLVKLFVLGIISTGPATLLEMLSDSWILPSMPISNDTLYVIVVALSVGLIEEICKFFFLFIASWNERAFNYRFDGVVYAVFVSLGFALLENILYVTYYGIGVALLRALLAVPGHTAFAIFMGIYFGRAKVMQVQGKHKAMLFNLIMSYVVAVALHTFYDATAMLGSGVALTLFGMFVVSMYSIVIRKVKKEAKEDASVY